MVEKDDAEFDPSYLIAECHFDPGDQWQENWSVENAIEIVGRRDELTADVTIGDIDEEVVLKGNIKFGLNPIVFL